MYLWLVILQASTSSSHHTKPDLYHYNLIQDGSSIRIEVNIIKLGRYNLALVDYQFQKDACYILISWKIASFFVQHFNDELKLHDISLILRTKNL